MVVKVKNSVTEPALAVEPIGVMAIEAAAPGDLESMKSDTPEKKRKIKATAVVPAETPIKPITKVVEPAKVQKPLPKPATTENTAITAKLPETVAAASLPKVKPASTRPSTAVSQVEKPSLKTPAGSPLAPAPKKELFAMVTTPAEFTDKMQTAFKDAQEKAKVALGDAGTFAKGNVEAMVESSKILATGLQDMTKGYVEETKTSFEAMTADVKDLAAVKSPTEFFEKQSALMRKNFDAAVAASSKNSEAMLKLVNEAFQPISTRVSLAVEKIKTVA